MGAASAALYVGTFAIQTMMVFASNSRLFGLLPEGSGWRTNVEMSILYTSLVTPANWAFARTSCSSRSWAALVGAEFRCAAGFLREYWDRRAVVRRVA